MSLPMQKVFKPHLPTYPRHYVEYSMKHTGEAPSSVSAADPSGSPDQPDFEYLELLSRRNKVVFRVHTPQSVCPLIWTGRNETSGFKAPNANLGVLEGDAYTRLFGDRRGTGGWANGPYWAHSMVDHILSHPRWTGSFLPSTLAERDNVPEDEKSPWISCSRSLPWCIWAIARRLVAPDAANEMEVAQGLVKTTEPDPKGRVVSLAIIMHHSGMVGLKDERRRQLELHTGAAEQILRALASRDKNVWTMKSRERYETAARRARISAEVLYYGRIFAESLDSNHEFTMEVCPIPLPERFWRSMNDRPGSKAQNGTAAPSANLSVNRTLLAIPCLEPSGWIRDLCWDPRSDSFDQAMRKMNDRQQEIKLAQVRATQGRGEGKRR